MVAVGVCLKGEALSWYRWRKKRQAFRRWAEFQSEVLKQFPASQDRTPYEELLSLRQVNSVRNYRLRFEVLSTAVEEVTVETLMNGFNPRCLEEMMERALQIEDKNWVLDAKMGLRPGTRVTRPSPRP